MAPKQNPRRLSAKVRDEHLSRESFLIQFEEPQQPMDMFRREVSPAIKPAKLLSGSEYQSALDKYRTMERKGFRVTKDIGCLIPHEQYCTYQGGATLKGHQRTFAFFGKWCPEASVLRNQYGWPISPQISHLCHRRSCCRPDHLIAEEQWRNQKRNYCGHDGECNCANEIKCLKRYSMEDQEEDPVFCATEAEVKVALEGAPKHVILSRGHFQDRDEKAQKRKANKESRKRRQSAHQHATERKQARLGAIAKEVDVANAVESSD